MSGGSRVPIPKSVQKTIQNIREITGNYSDEEVYAILKECSMDPSETAQKLLLRDPFHEVQRKRDRKKDNVSNVSHQNVTNREAAESSWRPSSQGRGSRGVRGSYSSRFISHDAGGGKNSNTGKDDPVNHGMDVGATIAAVVVQEVENKALGSTSSMPPGITNGPSSIAKATIAHAHASQVVISEETLSSDVNRSASAETKSYSSVVGAPRQPTPNTDQFVPPMTLTSASGVYSLASDPVLVPSLDPHNSGVVGTIKREVGIQRTSSETNKVMPRGNPESSLSSSSISERVSSEVGNLFLQGKIHGKSSSEASQLVTASHGISASSHLSSNYSSHFQQVIGPQKGFCNMTSTSTKSNPSELSNSSGSTTSEVDQSQASAQQMQTINGPLAIFWDFENCAIPSDVFPEDVARNIRMALRVHPVIKGAVTTFSAYGDFNSFPRRLREGCQRTGVKLIDVPHGRKDAADKAILIDMFLFALDNPPPSSILLISGDVDFAPALHVLGQRGYSIILVIPAGIGVSSALSSAGRFVWDWTTVARGEGFVPAKTAISRGPDVIDNLDPQNEEESNGSGECEQFAQMSLFNSGQVSKDSLWIPHSNNIFPAPCVATSRSQSQPSCLNDVVGDQSEGPEQTLWVQPGDVQGLKLQMVRLVELSGGSLPLVRVPAEYNKMFGRPLYMLEYGECKLVSLMKKMGDVLTVEKKGNKKFVCLRMPVDRRVNRQDVRGWS